MRGEGEYAQTDRASALLGLQFISELKCAVTIHEFGIAADGWAASHCQIGGSEAANAVIFEWLDKVVIKNIRLEPAQFDATLLKKYFKGEELERVTNSIRCSSMSGGLASPLATA